MDEEFLTRLQILRARWLQILAIIASPILFSLQPVPKPMQSSMEQAAFSLRQGNSAASAESLADLLPWIAAQDALRTMAAELALEAGNPSLTVELLSQETDLAAADRCLRFQAEIALSGPAQALELIEASDPGCPPPLEALQSLAQRALVENQPQLAYSIHQELLRLEPDNPDRWRDLALSQMLMDPTDGADLMRQYLQRDQEPDPVATNLVRVVERAEIEEDPAYTFAQIGHVLLQHERWVESAVGFKQAMNIDPNYYEAQAYLGIALERQGLDGLAALEGAHETAPAAPLPAFLLSQQRLAQGELSPALSLAKIAYQAEPENPAYLAQLAAAEAAAGDLQAAQDLYQSAVEFSGGRADFWLLLADFSVRNEVDIAGLAIPAARQAYRLDPSAAAADLLGYAYYLRGDYEIASRFLSEALRREPASAKANYHFGLLLTSTGQVVMAREHLARAVEVEPESHLSQLAERALEQLEDS